MVMTQADRDVIELYSDMLPKRIFDAHMHLYLRQAIPNHDRSPNGVYGREAATCADYLADMQPFLPGVEHVGMNMIPVPDAALADRTNGLREQANSHVFSMCDDSAERVASPFVLPTDSEEQIFDMALQPGTRAFKCYCYGAGSGPWDSVTIDRFLPETLWEVADEKKLPIVLHMMLPKALSDERNFAYITEMTRKYPDAKLILAHCARGFVAWTAVDAIRRLEDRGNIWFDLSAICESGPMMAAILKNAGKRVMWGSDYPVCMHRGRAVSVAARSDWLLDPACVGLERTRIVGENLLALKQTALLLELDATQLDDIFYRNARQLFFNANHDQEELL